MKIYTGPRGSGKTYHIVRDAFDKLSKKKYNHVVCNFGLKFSKRQLRRGYADRFHYIRSEDMTPTRLMELSAQHGWYKKEGSTLLIIDEAGLKFNARDWQVKGTERMEWIDFFVNSRKLGFDPFLVAQNIKMVDRQIRDIIEHNVKHAKLNNLHWFSWLPLPFFVTITKWLIGDFKPKIGFHIFDPFIARRYDTMKLFNPKILQIIEQMEAMETGTGEGVRGPTPDPATEQSNSKFKSLLLKWFEPKALEGDRLIEETTSET
ncbi:Zonular occludens toxin (Zot) [compost metagenome]